MVWFFGCFLVSIQSTSNIVIGRVQIHCMVRGTDINLVLVTGSGETALHRPKEPTPCATEPELAVPVASNMLCLLSWQGIPRSVGQ